MNKQQAKDALTKLGLTDIEFGRVGVFYTASGLAGVNHRIGRAGETFDQAVTGLVDYAFSVRCSLSAPLFEALDSAEAAEQENTTNAEGGLPAGDAALADELAAEAARQAAEQTPPDAAPPAAENAEATSTEATSTTEAA